MGVSPAKTSFMFLYVAKSAKKKKSKYLLRFAIWKSTPDLKYNLVFESGK